MTTTQSNEARKRLQIAETELNLAKAELARIEQNCKHDWDGPHYSPIRHEGYTIPGDTPGTMGVDWRGPFYVEAKTEDRWIKRCWNCGKFVETKQFTEKKETSKIPTF